MRIIREHRIRQETLMTYYSYYEYDPSAISMMLKQKLATKCKGGQVILSKLGYKILESYISYHKATNAKTLQIEDIGYDKIF